MRFLVLFLAVGILGSGCAKMKSWWPGKAKKEKAPVAVPGKGSKLTASFPGKVASVNTIAGFVVMTFPLGEVPSTNKMITIYRAGEKVAEVKVSGPQRDNNTVADILSGEPQVNDEARAD
jgi:hypothetical protein